jgi:hypothetical protein
MANSGGGFIIFGVDDDQARPPTARAAGLPPDQEFGRRLNDLLKRADPSVPHVLRNPPIAVPATRTVIQVVEIFSASAPHSFPSGTFHKRTNSGSEPATTREVGDMFSRREERLARLRLLLLELASAHSAAWAIGIRGTDANTTVEMRPIQTQVLATLHADLVPLFASHPEISGLLASIRALADVVNSQLGVIGEWLRQAKGVGDVHARYQMVHPLVYPIEKSASKLRALIAEVNEAIAKTCGVEPATLLSEREVNERGF